MKIGFFGNANNSPFMLARALRNAGHDVLFIIDRAEKLNRPENKYLELTPPYPDWIIDISPLDLWHYPFKQVAQRQRAIDLLKTCDVVILNQFGLSLADEIDKPTVALLTGTDLLTLADYRHYNSCTGPIRDFHFQLVAAQREGIRKALAVIYLPKGLLPNSDSLLEEIGVTKEQRIYYHLTEVDMIAPFAPPARNSPLRVFCIARLTWQKSKHTGYTELDFKGSDIMIRGLGLFWRTTRIPLEICLINKGLDVDATVDLLRAEGIADQVTWLEEMTQLEVIEQYRLADIVFEQMAKSVIGMGGVDAMAAARPLIANGRPEIFADVWQEPPPICQASTPFEVYLQLKKLVLNPEERHILGKRSRLFAEKHFSGANACKIVMNKVYEYFEEAPLHKSVEYQKL